MESLSSAAAITSMFANYPKAKETVDNILRLLDNRKIMVIGAGGTGKTSFCQLFSRRHNVGFDYEMSKEIEYYDLYINNGKLDIGKGRRDIGGKLDNYPGQPEKLKNQKWSDICEKITQDYYCGIIYVTAYGFHNLSTSFKNYEKAQKVTFHKDIYLNKQRSYEIELLQKLIQPLKQSCKDIWMLSLTTKQDLWFPDRDEVYNFYRHEGGYKSAIDEIKGCRGNKFSHEYAFLSVVSRKFIDSEDNVIQTFSGDYDAKDRQKSLLDFLSTLEILLKK
jgi:hypothetical protein